jgi:hypothetical protein
VEESPIAKVAPATAVNTRDNRLLGDLRTIKTPKGTATRIIGLTTDEDTVMANNPAARNHPSRPGAASPSMET